MTALQRAAAAAKRAGLEYTEQADRLTVAADNWRDYGAARAAMSRIKGAAVETWTAQGGGVMEGVVYVYDAAERAAAQESERRRAALVEVFWQAKRAGRTAEQAQAEQYAAAVAAGAVKEYAAIYGEAAEV